MENLTRRRAPTLRAREGELLRVHFLNASAHPHTIHFHGIHPSFMDGIPGIGAGLIATGKRSTPSTRSASTTSTDLAGAPAILGAWLGSIAFDASLAALLFGVAARRGRPGGGSDLARVARLGGRAVNFLSVAGIAVGFGILYVTSLFTERARAARIVAPSASRARSRGAGSRSCPRRSG
jgi:hypothetical protein